MSLIKDHRPLSVDASQNNSSKCISKMRECKFVIMQMYKIGKIKLLIIIYRFTCTSLILIHLVSTNVCRLVYAMVVNQLEIKCGIS